MKLSRRTLVAAAGAAAAPGLASADAAASFPFRVTRNIPWAPVVINDKDPPAPFMLSTGSAAYEILAEAAERYGLEKGDYGVLRMRGGEAIHSYRASKLLVGGSIRELTVPLAGRLVPYPEDLQGLVPLGIFGVFGLDFDSQMASMWRGGFTGKTAGYRDADLVQDDGAFYTVRVELDGEMARLRVLTNSIESIGLSPGFVERHGLWDRYPKSRYAQETTDLASRWARGQRLKIANVVFANPVMTIANPKLSQKGADPKWDGWVGMELLRRLNFVVDRQFSKLWIKPSQAIGDGYRYNRGGVTVDRANGAIRVSSVQPDGPAFRAGLRTDDKITGWRGRDGFYGLAWALLGAPGSVVEIQVERDGKPQLVAVTLEDEV